MTRPPSRQRIRNLIPDLHLGAQKTGPLNAITDVPGVLVRTQSIIEPATTEHHEINTGATVILPRKNYWETACHAGVFRFNGAGEMTGSHWLNETGLLMSPIVITGTFALDAAHEGVIRHFIGQTKDPNGLVDMFGLAVVAETWDGTLSDATALPLRPEHIVRGIDEANSGPVREGDSGGGTGIDLPLVQRCFVRTIGEPKAFTLGVLVLANYGQLRNLRIGGVPVGRKFAEEREQAGTMEKPPADGSIIIIIATDAPLSPLQLQRIAKRGTIGLSRVGGLGENYSGDIFLAFSTAAEVPFEKRSTRPGLIQGSLYDDDLNPFFEATADAVEEAIYNALCMAETMTGPKGVRIEAIDLKKIEDWVEPRLL